ncbi:pentatricopeptide repeat-containing protein At1g59720, chloroplastic/mitochondrial-like [Cornus florida]|uniref:pentatricopeptide repeat-containing protein At1g59720, chloroplastic/mitochondrial-like n=1 Tax=Cornus florida TaxID=4283 RepID=UPI00289D7B37|nr:pentatricopeptide repeat-containing protein At1g59720, chloroplastic/mitochondrial-like [Cornus florida]
MFSNYFINCLKSHQTKKKLSLIALPLSILNLCPFHSHTTTKSENLNEVFINSKVQTLLSLFKHCSTMKHVEQIHAHVIQTGFAQNLFVVGKIIAFCAISERGSMDYAVSVFEKIENPDGFLWNTIIRGFGRTCQVGKVFEYYNRMQERGEVADNFTFSFLLKVSGQLGSLVLGKQIHCNTLKHGLETHVYVRNTLIHVYGMLRDIDTARQLFEEMPSSNLVAWNTIIDCHVNCGEYKKALELFWRLLQLGVEPDEATLVVTLSACSALGALHLGRWVHSFINQHTYIDIVSVSNSLIDMYAKCGAVEEAYGTFNKMNQRNIVSWNTMILGLARHGHADKALQLFSKMLEEKLQKPNDVTFLGVLSACSHGGLVEEGRRYFDSMMKDYNVQPTIQHYGCMVDILGRAGFVEAAYQLIKSMPIDCNAVVWRTLMAACRLHGNVELGEQVRRHLLDLEPDHSSDYVLLANMYASAGQWSDTMKVRKSMMDRGVQKPKPGYSIIGIHHNTRLRMDTDHQSSFPL